MIRLAVFLALVGWFATSLASPARADLSDKLGALTATNAQGYLDPIPKALSSTAQLGHLPEWPGARRVASRSAWDSASWE